METIPQQQDDAVKAKIDRSAAYPAITLQDAIEFITSIHKHFPSQAQLINRTDVAVVLGVSESTINRDVAAAGHFNLLLKKEKGKYQITELYRKIKNSLTEKERRTCLLEAITSPTLFKELIEKYDGHAIPPDLRTHLIRFHRITEKAADDAAEVFIKSARFAGVLNENNLLNYSTLLAKINDPNFDYAEIITEENEQQQNNLQQTEKNLILKDNFEGNGVGNNKSDQQLLLPEMVNSEKTKIRLTGKRFAYLIHPSNLTKIDIEILRKQIDQLELIAE